MPRKKITKGLTAIVKPTHDCNLSCTYCYVDEDAEQGRMDDSTLEKTITKLVKFNGKQKLTEIIWHGGEPLLMGISFFQKVVELEKPLKEKGYKISNSVQTNGTLLTERLIDFFKKYKFRVGFSLDGPSHIQGETRRYKNGKRTFRNVLTNMKLARLKRIGGRGCIAILNRKSIDRLEELYIFFKNNKIDPKINPIIRSGRALDNYDNLSISPKEYGEAMIRLFNIWFYDKNPRISIDPFNIIIQNKITENPHSCNYSVSCQTETGFISMGPTGEVYPCGRFDGINEFHIGNINKDSMKKIMSSPIRTRLLKRGSETVRGCKSCKHKKICNSGCMHNAYMIKGNIMDKDYYCTGYKMLFDHITKTLHKELRKVEVKNEM